MWHDPLIQHKYEAKLANLDVLLIGWSQNRDLLRQNSLTGNNSTCITHLDLLIFFL